MLRIGTFNLENLDDGPNTLPPLEDRIKLLRPQIMRMRSDILCLQEVNAQKQESERTLQALAKLIEHTPYDNYKLVSTVSRSRGDPSDKHNLVTISRFQISDHKQFQNDLIEAPLYKLATSDPPQEEKEKITWDRPLLYTKLRLTKDRHLHVFNLHLRAPLASFIPGQKLKPFSWKSTSSWAEGCFLATIKRSGQALEARMLIDKIFDHDPSALVVVCGDFNAEEHEVPLRILIGSEDDTGNGSLSNRSLVPLERSISSDRRFSVIHHGRPQMLDHILVSRSMLAYYQGIEVHNESLSDEQIAYHSISSPADSYHAPLVAIFDINPLWGT
jgi:endonuclease/exonuclease/phosphatase family metal-dependent hydrolase